MSMLKRLAACGALLLLVAGSAMAQSDLSSMMQQQQKSGSMIEQTGEVLPLATPEEAMFALDEPIDPDEYTLGPGDVLGVSIPRLVGGYVQIMIGPDGTLAVPNLPVVKVTGMTITEARAFLSNTWSQSGKGVQMGLMQMRRMRVSVGGEVMVPGQYIVTPMDRASVLVELAFGKKRGAHQRRATLVHRDGSQQNVDLLRYNNFGALDANPRLQAGDHLVIFPKRVYSPVIAVGGAVVKPGSFPWIDGDDVMSAIQLAGGFDTPVLGDSIWISHLGDNGSVTVEAIAIAGLDFETNRGVTLLPGDAIRVDEKELGPTRGSIVVSGEVNRPGAYPVIPGETKLSDVIKMAGGFTQYAWLEGARVWRPWNNTDPRSEYARSLDSLTTRFDRYIDVEATRQFLRDSGRDYLYADFKRLYPQGAAPDLSYDVVVYDSMQVTVPREIKTVLVSGQVIHPGIIAYHEGWSYKDYVKQAGGFAKSAEKKRTRLIPYGSNVWYSLKSKNDIQPGDIIFVPEIDEKAKQQSFSDLAYLVLQGGTLVTLVWRTFFLN